MAGAPSDIGSFDTSMLGKPFRPASPPLQAAGSGVGGWHGARQAAANALPRVDT